MAGIEIKKKINLLGETGVGKTSLTLRFVKDVFGEKYLKTIGTNVYSKNIHITGSEIKLIIYDIMGDTGFDSVRDRAFKKSAGAVAVADITREETLDNLIDDWLPKYRRSAGQDAPILLAVNKVDLKDQELLTRKEVVEDVTQHFDTVFFTSAKTGENVEVMFKELVFRTIYLYTSPVDEQDIGTINDPKKLISLLLTYASELGDMSYTTREKIFEQSGIDKFSLDECISEQQALSFGNGLIHWYEKNQDPSSASVIRSLIEKYEEG